MSRERLKRFHSNLECGVLKLEGISTAKIVLFYQGSTELRRCENCIFVLPANILTGVAHRLVGPHDTLQCVLIWSFSWISTICICAGWCLNWWCSCLLLRAKYNSLKNKIVSSNDCDVTSPNSFFSHSVSTSVRVKGSACYCFESIPALCILIISASSELLKSANALSFEKSIYGLPFHLK